MDDCVGRLCKAAQSTIRLTNEVFHLGENKQTIVLISSQLMTNLFNKEIGLVLTNLMKHKTRETTNAKATSFLP